MADVPESIIGRSVHGKTAQTATELAYEYGLSLKPTHGGFLPRAIAPTFPMTFAPQPVGFVDPSAFGLSHEWAFGITYGRVILLFLDPEHLEHEIQSSEQGGVHPAPPKRISGPQQIALFDYPFVLASGQHEFLSSKTAPMQTTGLTAQQAEQRAQQQILAQFLEEKRRSGELAVELPGGVVAVFPENAKRPPVVNLIGGPIPSGGFAPISIEGITNTARASAENAKGINKEFVTERADP